MVDQNNIDGTATEIGGQVQKTVGHMIGDSTTQLQGMAKELAGKAQDAYGSAANQVGEWNDTLTERVKDQPLASLAIAVGVGFVLHMLMRSGRR